MIESLKRIQQNVIDEDYKKLKLLSESDFYLALCIGHIENHGYDKEYVYQKMILHYIKGNL